MGSEIRCILFATDLSEKAPDIFYYAANLASRYCARLIILHVLHEPPKQEHIMKMINNLVGEERWETIRGQNRQTAQDALIGKKKLAKEIREKQNLDVFCEYIKNRHTDMQILEDDILAIEGTVEKTILDVANEKECDVIVMGYGKHKGIVESTPGSIVKRVLHSSEIPVTLVPVQKRSI